MDFSSEAASGTQDPQEITSLLLAWRGGDEKALAELMPLVYRQLKGIATHLLRARSGHRTLQPTVLVHEAYLRLLNLDRLSWQDRAHFFAMSARLMRRVLVEHARYRHRAKRGGGEVVLQLEDLSPIPIQEVTEVLDLDDALKDLARHDAEMAQIVELRFFGGLNRDEIAEVLGIASATITRRWRSARAWLIRYLSQEGS